MLALPFIQPAQLNQFIPFLTILQAFCPIICLHGKTLCYNHLHKKNLPIIFTGVWGHGAGFRDETRHCAGQDLNLIPWNATTQRTTARQRASAPHGCIDFG
jgi:hypothetical protein